MKQESKLEQAAEQEPVGGVTKEKLLEIFKKVSLYDLSDCEFEYSDEWEENSWINAMKGTAVIDAIRYDGNIFWVMNNDYSLSPLNPMKPAFDLLLTPPHDEKITLVQPPSPVGIDVDKLAKDYAGKIRDTGMLLKRVIIADAFKAGYSASLPQSSTSERINQLESGIKQFLLWLKEKRPSMAGHGAPIMILEDLLNNKTNDLIKQSTSEETE